MRLPNRRLIKVELRAGGAPVPQVKPRGFAARELMLGEGAAGVEDHVGRNPAGLLCTSTVGESPPALRESVGDEVRPTIASSANGGSRRSANIGDA